MKDEGRTRKEKEEVIVSERCLHPSSLILYPSSLILAPGRNLAHPDRIRYIAIDEKLAPMMYVRFVD
jgi:hypothetical protein